MTIFVYETPNGNRTFLTNLKDGSNLPNVGLVFKGTETMESLKAFNKNRTPSEMSDLLDVGMEEIMEEIRQKGYYEI
jgi:ABC-type transporter lipoprotein component MlaA